MRVGIEGTVQESFIEEFTLNFLKNWQTWKKGEDILSRGKSHEQGPRGWNGLGTVRGRFIRASLNKYLSNLCEVPESVFVLDTQWRMK